MNILTTEVSFTGKDGKEYKFVPLDLVDMHKFVTWVKFKPLRDAIDADLPDDIRNEIKEQCIKGLVTEKVIPEELKDVDPEELTEDQLIEQEFEINFTSTIVQRIACSIPGLYKLMELSLEKNYTNYKDILDDKIVSKNSKDFLILIGYMRPKKKEEDENPTNPN